MKFFLALLVGAPVLLSSLVFAQNDSVSGLYYAVLYHQDSDYYQNAKITLRTTNPEGTLKISANVRVFFGPGDSTEYMTYDYNNVPLNLLTRQISIEGQENDVTLIGYLKDGKIAGDWHSSLIGRVGKFEAQKGSYPTVESGKIPIQALSGKYKGQLENKNSDSNLPERVTMTFVTTQDSGSETPELHVSGNMRFYLGDFDSQEYVETPFQEIQYNPYNRYVSAITASYGITIKGMVNHDGNFTGVVFSNGLGEVANLKAKKQ